MSFLDSYIINDHGALRDAYIAKAKAIGLDVTHPNEWYDRQYIYVLRSGTVTTGGMCGDTLARKHEFKGNTMTLTTAISFPLKTIHKGEEIVDAHGDLLLVAADDSVDTEAIVNALNKAAMAELGKE